MFTFTSFVDALFKARGHKYIKRIPYMSGGKRRYRYIYKVTHTHRGKRAFDAEHLDVGTAFALHTEAGAEFHGHITAVQGDQVTYRIDDGDRKGESVTVSKSELLNQLNDVHGIEVALTAERDKLRSQIEVAREKGSAKQVKRLQERLARLGGEEKRAEPASENLFLRLKGQAKNGETTNRQGVPKKYRGAYEKIFDILEGRSLGFTQVYGEESYKVDGDDMILEISPFPDADLLEKIRALRSVEEVEQETTEPESEEIRAEPEPEPASEETEGETPPPELSLGDINAMSLEELRQANAVRSDYLDAMRRALLQDPEYSARAKEIADLYQQMYRATKKKRKELQTDARALIDEQETQKRAFNSRHSVDQVDATRRRVMESLLARELKESKRTSKERKRDEAKRKRAQEKKEQEDRQKPFLTRGAGNIADIGTRTEIAEREKEYRAKITQYTRDARNLKARLDREYPHVEPSVRRAYNNALSEVKDAEINASRINHYLERLK
tara:strand:+ start:1364 stop:2866 length:1503 start_codon:yes stop_codon:yes gene_type:complete